MLNETIKRIAIRTIVSIPPLRFELSRLENELLENLILHVWTKVTATDIQYIIEEFVNI